MAKQQQRTRRLLTAEFKREAVRRTAERRAQGASMEQIGRELDVSADLLRSWVHMLDGREDAALTEVFPGQGRPPSEQDELQRLQREVHRLQQENAF